MFKKGDLVKITTMAQGLSAGKLGIFLKKHDFRGLRRCEVYVQNTGIRWFDEAGLEPCIRKAI